MNKQKKANIALLIITVGWGTSFILTKDALAHLEVFNFLFLRFGLAALISGIIFYKRILNMDKKTLIYGAGVGVLLFCHYIFQTLGLNYTTASNAAFITGTSVVIVPLLGAIVSKKIPQTKSLVGASIALIGLAFMTLKKGTGINIGDFYTFVSAILFAVYILTVARYTKFVDSIAFTIVQMGVVSLMSIISSFILETPTIPQTPKLWINFIVLSVVCTSGAFIVQNVAQKYTTASSTALIYSAEPVFAAIFAYIYVGEILGKMAILGGVLILVGMLVAEMNFAELVENMKYKFKQSEEIKEVKEAVESLI